MNKYVIIHGQLREISDDELMHWGKKGEARKDHKYIKREWVNGRWRYYYDVSELKTNIKNNIDEFATKLKTTSNKTLEDTLQKTSKSVNTNVNTLIDKAKSVINKLYEDPDNMYFMNRYDYQDKMAKVKESEEWKKIVASNDPEYVQKNADGTTTYLIDDYVVKKKHPVLDILSDVAAGRKADINEITKESTIASIRDHGTAIVNMGMIAVGVVSKALTEKFKFQQGSYESDIKKMTSTIDKGLEYTKATINNAPNISQEYIEQTVDMVKSVESTINKTKISNAAKSINEGNVIKAAQIIMESDAMKNAVGSNEYYRLAETALSNMSDEEMAALSLLLRQMYSR